MRIAVLLAVALSASACGGSRQSGTVALAIKEGGAVPDDYYLSNPSTLTATLPVSKHPGVTVVRCDAGCSMGAKRTWASVRRQLSAALGPGG